MILLKAFGFIPGDSVNLDKVQVSMKLFSLALSFSIKAAAAVDPTFAEFL